MATNPPEDPLRRLAALKEQCDRDRREADRAAGALGQQLAALASEFGCPTAEAGAELLGRLRQEADAALKEYQALEAAALRELQERRAGAAPAGQEGET